jgi:tetratricopeptide (TPR) repeat protein
MKRKEIMNRLLLFTLALVSLCYGCANSAKDYMQNGITFYNKKEYAGALEHFQRALEREPKMAEIYFHRGNLYQDWNKQHEKAIQDYTSAIQLRPEYVAAYNKRAELYRLQNKHDEAMKDYQKIIELEPTNARAYYNLALIDKQRYDESKEYKYLNTTKLSVNKAIELDPENVHFYRTRAQVWVIEKEYTKAIDDYNKMLKLDPSDLRALMDQGIVYFEMGDYEKAFQSFAQCEEKGFQHPLMNEYRKKIRLLKNKGK